MRNSGFDENKFTIVLQLKWEQMVYRFWATSLYFPLINAYWCSLCQDALYFKFNMVKKPQPNRSIRLYCHFNLGSHMCRFNFCKLKAPWQRVNVTQYNPMQCCAVQCIAIRLSFKLFGFCLLYRWKMNLSPQKANVMLFHRWVDHNKCLGNSRETTSSGSNHMSYFWNCHFELSACRAFCRKPSQTTLLTWI